MSAAKALPADALVQVQRILDRAAQRIANESLSKESATAANRDAFDNSTTAGPGHHASVYE